MMTIKTFQWPGHRAWKTVNEDAFFVDEGRAVIIVADGITRRGFSGEYPNPSPAAAAAAAAADAMGRTLAGQQARVTLVGVRNAFKRGNAAVQVLNKKLSLWDDHNWWDRDLAGTVAACLVVKPHRFLYGFIGDCGVAHFVADGRIQWRTPDLVAPATAYSPSIEEIGQKQRFITVRRDFRNRPQAPHPTFGVLTGEKAALSYVQAGSRSYTTGDILAVYSDGAAPFVVDEATFSQLLATSEASAIQDYVAQRSSSEQHNDEKTLIIVRT